MQKRFFLSFSGLAAVALFVGCQSVSDPMDSRSELAVAAKGKGAVQATLPVSFSVPDCDGQAIAVSGRLHTVTRVQLDGRGRFHVMLHGNFQNLVGIGSSGDTLTGGGAGQVTGVFDTLPQTVVDTFRLTLVSGDSADTLIATYAATFTINADGTVSTSYSAPVAVCEPDTADTDTTDSGTDSGEGGDNTLSSGAVGPAGAGPGEAPGRMESPTRIAWNPRIGPKAEAGT